MGVPEVPQVIRSTRVSRIEALHGFQNEHIFDPVGEAVISRARGSTLEHPLRSLLLSRFDEYPSEEVGCQRLLVGWLFEQVYRILEQTGVSIIERQLNVNVWRGVNHFLERGLTLKQALLPASAILHGIATQTVEDFSSG